MAGPSGNPSSGAGHGGSTNGASTGGHGADMAVFFAQRQVVIERMMKYFAAGICGLVAVFVVFHWARWACVKVERSKKPAGVLGRPFVASSRLVRNLLVRKVPGFKSAGHAIVVTAYVVINLAVLFTNVDTTSMGSLGHRFGWITLMNLALVVFLALKNTPLAFITAYSYERLNCLHQIAGCTMFICMVIHGALYTAFFNSQGRLLSIFAERGQIAAIVAGFAFLSVVFSALVVRRLWYELFYVTHISSWIIAIVAVGFHQPEFGHKILIVTVLAASMWVLDRVIRACRLLYYSANNEATLHPLPDGGTKIVMKKVPARAEPGKHCFVWIPAIRKFETHPFTIHRSSPFEFTVKACNGFTSDLHKFAVAHPGAAVRASIDGPYGTFPDPMEFDKIVLIAGGGGATFTFGLAVNILERMDEDAPKDIVFIWAVQKHENLSWFKEQLDLLRTHAHSPKVNISLYVTRASSSTSDLPSGSGSGSGSGSDDHTAGFDSSSEGTASPPLSPVGSDPEKNGTQVAPSALRWPSLTQGDLEKETGATMETRVDHSGASGKDTASTAAAVSHTFVEHAVKAGRPDAASLIRDALKVTPRNQRVLVAACGPDGLMRVVRDTTAKLIVGDGPAVELHCEQFGW
ncbi:ferric reductase NAD binding domain-containing protein [Chaetomidium leptoderma]|uniref:Ferric reductase NAD binding domain-containing protein n=1 Tax=Chaetomidium leptoderma TaxID=669021 RepID=A0AAN6ZXV2_9PEZI|nr:ferric reductase NAD binding domain-containing protein [Chaetomidium leptoderma]